ASYDNASADGPPSATNAPVDPNVERPASAWQPLLPDPAVRPPSTVLLVDGVRRIDARVWLTDDNGDAYQGLCASYAAGVVRCDADRGVAELADARVAHGVFLPGPAVTPIAAHPRAVYRPHQVGGADQAEPALQSQLHQLEVQVSE